MALSVDAIRAEMERVDAVRKAMNSLREEINTRLPDGFDRDAILVKVDEVEAIVLNKKLEPFTPDVKILVIGTEHCGKTALIRRFFANDFSASGGDKLDREFRKPPGERVERTVQVDGKPVKVAVTRQSRNLTPQLGQWADVVVLVYNVKDAASFEQAYAIFHRVMRYNDEANVVLVGTGVDDAQDAHDVGSDRAVPMVEGRRLSYDMHGVPYFEVSALTGFHVQAALDEAIRLAQKTKVSSTSPDVRSRKEKFKMNVQLKDKSKNKQLDTLLRHLPRALRPIPDKQGWLLKQGESVVKEWKRKYCILGRGQLIYYSSMLDYFKDENGKSIALARCTVKPAAGRPHGAGAAQAIGGSSQTLAKSNTTIGSHHATGGGGSGSFSLADFTTSAEKSGPAPGISINVGSVSSTGESGSGAPAAGNAENSGGGSGLAGVDVASQQQQLQPSEQHGSDGEQDDDGDKRAQKQEKSKMTSRGHQRRKSSIHKYSMANLFTDDGVPDKDGSLSPGQIDPQSMFQIVSLQNDVWTFMAPSPEEARAWMQAIQDQIMEGLKNMQSAKTTGVVGTRLQEEMEGIRGTKGNGECAECSTAGPEWASINLGELICIECSGIHRNLGVQYSRVRSLALDDWHAPALEIMNTVGNAFANAIWEAQSDDKPLEGVSKPTPAADRAAREKWIRVKYVDKTFLAPLEGVDPADNTQMINAMGEAIDSDDPRYLYLLCAHLLARDNMAAVVNAVTEHGTLMHRACLRGSLFAMQMLIWLGADVTIRRPEDGATPAELAANMGHGKGIADLLESAGLKGKAPG